MHEQRNKPTRLMRLLPFLLILFPCTLWAQAEYKLEITKEYASCLDFELRDRTGMTVPLPDNVRNALVCPAILDLRGDTLTFMEDQTVKLYYIREKREVELFSWDVEMDGVAGPCWSPSGKKVLFIIINQERTHGFESFCRINILTLGDDGEVAEIDYYDRPVNFVCGSICWSDCGEDYRFIDENTIEYKRNENIDGPPDERIRIVISE